MHTYRLSVPISDHVQVKMPGLNISHGVQGYA